MRESSPACIAKPALPRENRTRGAHDSQTLGSNRAANGNASPAKAPSFSRSNNCKNSITFDGEGYSVSAAEAKGGDAALQISALQFIQQSDEDARRSGRRRGFGDFADDFASGRFVGRKNEIAKHPRCEAL